MVLPASELLHTTRNALRQIGYRDDLLISNYRFADVFSLVQPVGSIDLAAFAQEPPSYRNACLGITLTSRDTPTNISRFRALGAPQIFAIEMETGEVHRWKMTAEGQPKWLESIGSEHIVGRILAGAEEWGPDQVLRAKSIAFEPRPAQLDFFDIGLLPVLEREVQTKLDQLLRNVIALGANTFAERYGAQPTGDNSRKLFRLVFRLIAAKLLGDRLHPGDWLDPDADTVVRAVESFYFQTVPGEPVLADQVVRQAMWDEIRSGIHLQNLSVEALAYVYENTLVSKETRIAYGTHATPPEIAEYIVQALPFENLGQDERYVFEPFSGHAPFLVAALGRLKLLLPTSWDSNARHQYFVRMLSGIELDAFAREVARYSLMLADYPNPNGWQIDLDNAFTSSRFDTYLQRAQIVLANPPYEDFEAPPPGANPNKAVEAVNRILKHPPAMLGLVLPRVFIDGRSYRDARRRLIDTYGEIRTVVLPDIAFHHSESETVAVVAFGNRVEAPRLTSMYVGERDYDRFTLRGIPSWKTTGTATDKPADSDAVIWQTPLDPVWKYLAEYPRLKTLLANSARGIEYTIKVREHRSELVLQHPAKGFVPGLLSVPGDFEPYITPEHEYISLSKDLMRTNAYTKPWHMPKVIVNSNRKGRGPWTIVGVIDREGLTCYQNFHGLWPQRDLELEVLAAIVNSPVANAYISTHRSGRHNRLGFIRDIPIPMLNTAQRKAITELVQAYEMYRREWIERGESDKLEAICSDLLTQIDAEVLRAYDLAPRHEREVLNFFSGHIRPVPVEFTTYYPSDFKPAIPWSMFASAGFRRAAARRTLTRLPKINDPAISAMVDEL